MKILITGSRDASKRLLDMAAEFVKRFPDAEYIVGDAPGIDSIVIKTCDEIGAQVTVFGAYGKLRNTTRTGKNIALQGTYPERDRHMAGLDIDHCVAFWNGSSRGTMITARAAKANGVETIVVK